MNDSADNPTDDAFEAQLRQLAPSATTQTAEDVVYQAGYEAGRQSLGVLDETAPRTGVLQFRAMLAPLP